MVIDKYVEIVKDQEEKMDRAIINFKKTAKSRITITFLEKRLELLNAYWTTVESNHELILTESSDKTHAYFMTDMYNKLERKYIDYKTALRRALSNILSPQVCQPSPDANKRNHSTDANPSSVLKPPRMVFPVISDVMSVMTADPGKQVQYSTCNPQDTDDTCKPQDTDDTSESWDEYKCHMCKIDFVSKKLFRKHKCCVCKICNKPRAISHWKCPKVFTCKCGETFTHNRDFTTHQKNHAEIYGSCPTCSKQFTNETDLIDHVNNMKFPCIFCDTCFPDLEALLAHNTEPPDTYETLEDILAATHHSRTHRAPTGSYTRKQNFVNGQKKKRKPVNIVKGQISDASIENGEPEPQDRVNVKDSHEERWFAKDKKERCYKRSNKDFGVTEPKLRCVKVELNVNEETRNPNSSQHLGGVRVLPDLRDKPNDNCEVVTNTSAPFRDKDMREAVDNEDVMTLLLFEIEDEVRREIKKEPNERLEPVGFDEVMDDEQDLKAWPKLSTSELYAGHLVVDGIALGPTRVRVPTVYTGKNALRTTAKQEPATNPPSIDLMFEPCSVKVESAELSDEIEALDVKSEDV